MDMGPSIPTALVWRRKVIVARRAVMPDVEALNKYLAPGKAGKELGKLPEGGGDKRRRHDLRCLGGG